MIGYFLTLCLWRASSLMFQAFRKLSALSLLLTILFGGLVAGARAQQEQPAAIHEHGHEHALPHHEALPAVTEPTDNKAQQPYTIRKPAVDDRETDAPLRVLLLTSGGPEEREYYAEFQLRIERFVAVISSHWDIDVTQRRMDSYQAGEVKSYDVLLVIDEYNGVVNQALLDDIAVPDLVPEVVWFGFATEQLLTCLDGLPHGPVDQITSEAVGLTYKDVAFDGAGLRVLGSLIGNIESEVEVVARFTDNKGYDHPLIVDIKDRCLLLPFEIPFDYRVSNYSLITLDALHRSLGHHTEAGSRQAMVRLEDVNAFTYRNPASLVRAYELFKERSIPFHIAFIEKYINPDLGLDLRAEDERLFFRVLQRMVGEGLGILVQHGYTHQVGNEISGIGFEFWDSSRDAPLEFESEEYVKSRIELAQAATIDSGLPLPDIWETPHYALSELSNEVLNEHYPLRYEHIPNLGSLPFPVNWRGAIYLPENLGFAFGTSEEAVDRISTLIDQISTFEDPVSSFFWHPWRDTEELRQIVGLLEEKGYTFVSAYDLLETEEESLSLAALASFRSKSGALAYYDIADVLIVFTFAMFILGALVFALNRFRFNRYLGILQRERITEEDLSKKSWFSEDLLPHAAIIVPARNEGFVIENTVRRLARLHYPKNRYSIVVVVDEREQDDDVEILTKDAVLATAKAIREETGHDLVHCFEVPKWYSGSFGNDTQTYGQSSKGRALNWALQEMERDEKMVTVDTVGVLDADGRLDHDALINVGYQYLMDGSQVLQGPVLQISNVYDVSLVGVAAGMELAMHHLTELPTRLFKGKKVQFLAGTNYFIEKNLIVGAGGWDQHALVEDAELALRLYIHDKIKSHWLNIPEFEQTPPSARVYVKQRERWARGHLQLVKLIREADLKWREKFWFYYKITTAQLRVFVDLGIPILSWTLLVLGFLISVPLILRILSVTFVFITIIMLDNYGYVYRSLISSVDANATQRQLSFMSLRLLLFSPFMVLIQAWPRMLALKNHLFKNNDASWYKTERSREAATTS